MIYCCAPARGSQHAEKCLEGFDDVYFQCNGYEGHNVLKPNRPYPVSGSWLFPTSLLVNRELTVPTPYSTEKPLLVIIFSVFVGQKRFEHAHRISYR